MPAGIDQQLQPLLGHKAATNSLKTVQIPPTRMDVVSCGVPISSYNSAQALDAVADKSFSCTSCGRCCTMADDSEVWLNNKELAAIAQHLRVPQDTVVLEHLQPYAKVPGWWLLQSKHVAGPWPSQHQQASNGQQPRQQQERQVCVFLDAATNACGIYPVRPLQCSTFPWWPEMMSPGVWQAQQQVCEGIEHPDAPQLDRWQAAQQLQLAAEHTLSLEAAKPADWDAQEQLYSDSNT